ncbi:phosphotransferase [Pseudomonas sp. TH41]|uniref:phosphotransferase enzyme family protein n=1 Tax=Pseudomonas sp. TH41 TaxID=2796405 RepID=UPI001912E490|nr:phosphotransferase [Pseudomonas sp. TH41]MBK5354387.1 phosphotransferase [Pseudomonas sp. TH41]
MSEHIEINQEQMLANLQGLARASLHHWDMDCLDIALIKYRENAVFTVETTNGHRYALRVHRGGYHSDAALRSELQWMAALQQFGIEVPVVVPTSKGDLFILATLPSTGEILQIDLFEWIEGCQLGTAEGGLGDDIQQIEHTYRTIGNIAARLHEHGRQWHLPEGFKRHAWDAEGLAGEDPFWGRFWELGSLSAEQRQLILTARDIVRSELQAITRTPEHDDYYGLIHADFVPENLMISGDTVRLLDFDDSGFGWHLFELATALYFIRRDANFNVAHDALIEGYRAHRALPEKVLAKLPVFMMARAFTYLGWVQTREGSDVAKELAPFLTELACDLAAKFVETHGGTAQAEPMPNH